MDNIELIKLAMKARENSYSPYSGFAVGACLLAKNGKVYLGCNIENSSYTPTICAERVAFFKAVSEGITDFEAIAIIGGLKGTNGKFTAPCGVCRQVMSEFCKPDFRIVLGTPENVTEYKLSDVLPLAFTPESLN